MKKIMTILVLVIFVQGAFAQAKSKEKTKDKTVAVKEEKVKGKKPVDGKTDKIKSEKSKHEAAIWEGTKDSGGGPKPSKNQPAKVRAAFQRDYPGAAYVSWSKYRGDWTATFQNGPFLSTAVYHANGERKDTRSLISRPQLPPVILDDVFKRNPKTEVGEIIKIELPFGRKGIFRVKTLTDGSPAFLFYDADGKPVEYNY
jgi:hypothetical protein